MAHNPRPLLCDICGSPHNSASNFWFDLCWEIWRQTVASVVLSDPVPWPSNENKKQ